MKGQIDPDTAKARIAERYTKLHTSLLELVDALNIVEPGGTLAEDVHFTTRDGSIKIAYSATPINVRIYTPECVFILRVIERTKSG